MSEQVRHATGPKPTLPDGSLVLFGGTSDIGLAIAEALLGDRPGPVTLVARPQSPRLARARARMVAAGATGVRVVGLDVRDLDAHEAAVDHAMHDPRAPQEPVRTVIIAFGALGDPEAAWQDPRRTRAMFTVNTTAAASIGALVAEALRAQRRGGGPAARIIAVSSVAAERVRRSNFVYGASKAGMDGFFIGLGQALAPEHIRVLVVRPGFVRSAMTVGRRAGLAVDPDRVADAVVRALDTDRAVVRVPRIFTPLMAIYRNLPDRIARRLAF
ncbi:SDR family NAD(P)-dependent oxidoreductase [Propionibacterium freudenreichii]|uniref:SDR family NAD(P)-dependent oxidoreductase n=2 Tax=Propionibacterium freudenreichii TaxID=1744 RepID=UPI0005A5C2CD|nr:SDR family NAD(P)-dependent oxidoreductase [Propionibacterium freudenreichii]CEI31993.1 Dehydrogenase [Propionibacterium freudenreichii]SBN40424.1 Putative oxidoreductase in MprA 5'region [Propionibacterium freudenreichii]SCQ55237.1 Putative oxidoreductase in MprA 5'region [Propionibacterium freudenreichii]SCQ57844.1 Putative oxidoreductase in MprA 5'region [Propionibacterium freudenreichii]SCQ60619.1 Putative oxidoreductase in MprA 5'region [Propionibacterium freudenreichii]